MINYSTSMVLFGDPLLCPRQEEHTFLPFTIHRERRRREPRSSSSSSKRAPQNQSNIGIHMVQDKCSATEELGVGAGCLLASKVS